MKFPLSAGFFVPVALSAHTSSGEIISYLAVLTSVGFTLSAYLFYRIERLKKERDEALKIHEIDSKIIFLQSRYASIGETLGNIAHQWKQPLNAIGTIQNNIKAALIFQGEISKEKLLHSVDTSFKLLQHLGETIDTFYSFLTQQHNEKKSFVIGDEFETIRKITEYSFENSHIQLLFDLQANPTIQGNPNEFTHAILNLILNAKDAFDDASTDSPLISVVVRGGEKICTITVSDNAGGIVLMPLDIVFDLHITTKEHGSGLGLFMTKNIIENRFGGNISVENKNGGAYFTVELPYSNYNEHFLPVEKSEEQLTLDRINQLTHKIIGLAEIEKNLKKWADIFEQAQWGIVICGANSRTLDLMNPAFAQIHGFTTRELSGKPIESIFAPECRDYLQGIIDTVHKESHYVFESIHFRKDGSQFPVAIDITAVKDEDENVLYLIANVRDITEKKTAEERLLLKRFALDHIKDAVFLIDENANFHYVNDAACNTLGYTQEKLLTMRVIDITPNFPIEQWRNHWKKIKELGKILSLTEHQRKDGTVFPIEVNSNYFEYNGVGYSLAVSRDITERQFL